jgi:hypothetical protein
MRRSIFALSVASFALFACEDGPNQTYSPAAAGAAGRFNNGNTPPTVDPTKGSFAPADGGNGTNQAQICDAKKQHDTWAAAFKKPITPPRFVALLDIAGGENWQGLTIDDADKVMCQSNNYGDLFGDGNQANYWGDNAELLASYRPSNRKIFGFLISQGYEGTIELKGRQGGQWDGATYSVSVNAVQMQKNSQNWDLHWATDKNYLDEGEELYDAYINTLAPAFPKDPVDGAGKVLDGQDCQSTRRCIVGSFGDVAYFYIPALGSALWIASRSAAQPEPSTLNRIDQDVAKVMSFSFAAPLLKMDQVGPTGSAGTLASAPAACTLQMGLQFSDFLGNCVKVTGDSQKDTTEYNKLLGGLSHSNERFHFDVQGVDVNFTAGTWLAADKVIGDKDLPNAADLATQFNIDQSTLGFIANDRIGDDITKDQDNHGAGLVYLEYARLVQADLNKYIAAKGVTTHPLGDPACLPGATSTTFAAGCTGFEGFITPTQGYSSTAADLAGASFGTTQVPSKFANGLNKGMAGGLKPGHLQAIFCNDPDGNYNTPATGYKKCAANPQLVFTPEAAGATGDIFITSYKRVLSVLGGGQQSSLPSEAQDVRFYFKRYATAVFKYFQVAGVPANETVDSVHSQWLDPDTLFFDSIGAGQFESGEYVDRRFASTTQPPLDLVLEADVKNGIFDGYNFSRVMTRGESALYDSMLEKPATDGIGQESNALLTNIFGSPVLQNGWKDVSANGATLPAAAQAACGADSTVYCAYYCATTLDRTNCTKGGVTYTPPLDSQGNVLVDTLPSGTRPILAPYKGAFGQNRTVWTLGTDKVTPTTVKIKQTYDPIQSAMVQYKLFTNPYDPTSDPRSPSTGQMLVGWTPKQPGVGFNVPLTGTRNKFISTSEIEMGGTTISADVFYDAYMDPNTGQPATDGTIAFKAVDTNDFLGMVFLCQDKASHDVLSVRMYTPVADILDWLAAHPGAYNDCGIIIRYSPFGNYADYITSLTNGVTVGVTQGGGFGRVVDAMLFTPGQ